MKIKKAGLLTKIVVLALLLFTATTMLGMRGKIQAAQNEVEQLSQQVADQTQKNAELSDALANSSDPEVLQRVAREKGYVMDGERIMVDVSN